MRQPHRFTRFTCAIVALAAFLAAGACPALAQSPYAGSWRGTLKLSVNVACNPGATQSCTYFYPWVAQVDSSGLSRGLYGPIEQACNGQPVANGVTTTASYFIPANGSVSPAYSFYGDSPSLVCGIPAQYASSPSLTMSGSVTNCPPYTVTFTNGTVCTYAIQQGNLEGKGIAAAFPMTISTNIGATVSSASVNLQYRAQDVGRNGSVYAFAVAPANLVRPVPLAKDALPPLGYARSAGGGKDEPVACVLAQLNSTGQLQAVSASSLQAYVTGVLSGQGQAVQVINGVSTATIAGTTFFVGYGSNAAAMLSGGLNRSVATVPGSRVCAPQAPQTGWWWNAAEGGRGFSIEARGNNLFYAGFLYDESGRSKWYVAAGPTSLDGSLFTGNLLQFNGGQTLAGAYRAPGPEQVVGPFTLAFSDAVNATMVWPGGTVALERFPIVPNGLAATAQANVPESGWWWNEAESGRGYFIEWQGGTAFMAGYMYDEAGNPVWYLSSYATPDPRQFSGNWWSYANGQTLTGPYKPATQVSNNVAPLSIRFDTATTGFLTLPGNREVAITRFRF